MGNGSRGMSLVITMILLVIMSLLGIVVVNKAMQETRIASNYRDTVLALSLAKSGIEYGRARILGSTTVEGTIFPFGDQRLEVNVSQVHEESAGPGTSLVYFRITSIGRHLDLAGSFPENVLSTRAIVSIERLTLQL